MKSGTPCRSLRGRGTGPVPAKAQSRQQCGSTWISHSQMPTRTLPNTPMPGTLIRNTGLSCWKTSAAAPPHPFAVSLGGTALCCGPGTDGVAAHQPQQQCRAAGAVHLEQRFHQPRQPGGGQFPKAQPQQQGGNRQKRNSAGMTDRAHRASAADILPDLPGVRQKPHQHAAQKGGMLPSATVLSFTSPLYPMPFSGRICREAGTGKFRLPPHTVAKR